MKLHLYHGRNAPKDELDDWGFDGPTFECEWIAFTYMTTIRIGFSTNEEYEKAKGLTGWREWDDKVLEIGTFEDLIVANGKYYGDWSVDK